MTHTPLSTLATAGPLTVRPFRNVSGSESFRVEGKLAGSRIRKNFRDYASAVAFCDAKNAEVAEAHALRLVQTRLGDDDLRAAEAAKQRAAGRWPLDAILMAGIEALEAAPPEQPIAALLADWLILIRPQVSSRWYRELKMRTTSFLSAHPQLTTTGLTRPVVRRWLDGLDVAPQTKANMRNAVHRFAGWLVERGIYDDNPASGIRIGRPQSAELPAGSSLPAVLSPLQTEALLTSCLTAEGRRLLGWVVLCLFVGLRPESEAERLVWTEIDLSTSEISVLGRKRGAKPRIVPLQAAAIAWLRIAKADAMPQPGFYLIKLRRRVVELANEWLREQHPEEPPIVWVQDILRHSYASYRDGAGVNINDLAREMGNSPRTIYAHYLNPRTAAQVKAFWAILPSTAPAAARKSRAKPRGRWGSLAPRLRAS
jgi:integrase